MIEVKELVKNYGDRRAVDHLTFTLEKGHIYGFLGSNGAGKSTTMNMMTGYIAMDEGSVTVFGHDITNEPEAAKRHIGYLPEQPPLYNDMTIDEYLSFVIELKGVPKEKRESHLKELKEMTMIAGDGGRMIRNLSKGYRQRVGLAQALVGMPDVIILDEPTVGLDPQQIIDTRELISSLKDDHIVILSSHILSEIEAVCDELIIISSGRMVGKGTVEELTERFASGDTVTVRVKGSEAEVKKALEDASLTVTDIHAGAKSLEEVFLSLTSGSAGS